MLDLVVAGMPCWSKVSSTNTNASASTARARPARDRAMRPTDAAAPAHPAVLPGGIIDRARPAFEAEPFRHQEQQPALHLGEDAPTYSPAPQADELDAGHGTAPDTISDT